MNLTDREKKLLIGGAILVAVVFLWAGVRYFKDSFFQFSTDQDKLKAEEQELIAKGSQYIHLKNLKAGNDIDLDRMSITVETLLKAHDLYETAKVTSSDNLIEKKYQKRTMKIMIGECAAIYLLKFTNDVENQSDMPMVVDRLSMTPILNKTGMYRALMEVSSFQDISKGKKRGN